MIAFMKTLVILLMAMLTSSALARETVTVIYPWGMGDPMANYTRTLLEVANRQQDKFVFVLENRPGAGGAIAAKHVQNTPNSILAGSTAFFVRPNFYPETSHDIDKFRPLMTQCTVPMVISSNRYRSWADIAKDTNLLVGVSGLGATTHLVALQIKQKYSNITVVPYKSTQDSTLDLVGSRIDLNIGFPQEVAQWIAEGKAYGLGVTGSRTVNGIATMSSLGYRNMDRMGNGHSLIVNSQVPQAKFLEWRSILLQASKDNTVQQSYAVDHCVPMDFDLNQTERWYAQQVIFWKQQSNSVALAK
jgi:tripartite-type tricarboxylate transporter receptor subunit TctC